MNEPTLHESLKVGGNIWHIEIYNKPFCQNLLFNQYGLPCEIDLLLWNNDVLCRTLDRIESIISTKPTLVKGKCPHTKI